MVYEYPDDALRGAAVSAASPKGDCGEFSFVFCALRGSLGVPARTITCVWLTEGGHGWAEVLLPGYGWVPVDPFVAQGLAGESAAFGFEQRTRAFAVSLGVLGVDPDWLSGNVYWEPLIICVGNHLEVERGELDIVRTFRFLQPVGALVVPPAFEAVGFAAPPVEAGFFVFGAASDDVERAKAEALRRMAPSYLAVGERGLIPASALLGACLRLAPDIVAKTVVAPVLLPVGAITALVGGPLPICMLRRRRAIGANG